MMKKIHRIHLTEHIFNLKKMSIQAHSSQDPPLITSKDTRSFLQRVIDNNKSLMMPGKYEECVLQLTESEFENIFFNIYMNKKYLPKSLSRKDMKKQFNMLKRSIRDYKKGKYYTRKQVKSFKSKPSGHVANAVKTYKVNKITANKNLSKKTGCKVSTLRKIVKKGMGAYYSSGSRPNQTAQSWGRARLASAITGGPSSKVDIHELKKGCSKKSKALRLAKKFVNQSGGKKRH